jgi:hypothetical protein
MVIILSLPSGRDPEFGANDLAGGLEPGTFGQVKIGGCIAAGAGIRGPCRRAVLKEQPAA